MSVEHRLGFFSFFFSFGKNNWYANLNPQLFLSGYKNFHVHKYPHSNRIYPSTRIRIHSSTQDLTGNIGNRACVVKRPNFASNLTLREPGNKLAILNTVFKVKSWARSCKVAGNLRSASILVPLCSPLLLTDVTQAFVIFWYTQRYTTTHLTRNNLTESTNVTTRPFLQEGQTNCIFTTTNEQRKIIDVTTYPANPKILST